MNVLRLTRRLVFATALFAPTLALAQPPGPPEYDPLRAGARQAGQVDERPFTAALAIMNALDTNRDGELSPEEIRNASTALKSLDRNRDGTVDRSELLPRGGRLRGQAGFPGLRGRGAGRGGPPPDGPDDAPPPGPGRGGRPGGPPPDDPNGPPGGGRPPLAGRGRPEIGHVFPPFVRDELGLTNRQLRQIAALESEVKGKLESILTPAQLRQLNDLLERGPAGPGGPGGPGRGNAPGEGPPDDDEPPVRPQRPPK